MYSYTHLKITIFSPSNTTSNHRIQLKICLWVLQKQNDIATLQVYSVIRRASTREKVGRTLRDKRIKSKFLIGRRC